MKKVVLITGASSGIGRQTALVLQYSGAYTVYGTARRTDRMTDLKDIGINVLTLDVTDDKSISLAVQAIVDQEGQIDILVNNAGYGLYGTIEDVSPQQARAQFDVNVFGLARMTQIVLPYMRGRRQGKIVNISSIGGKMATPLGGWYYASKHAVEALSDSLRNEVKEFGIDIIIIEPGGVKTEWPEIAAENMLRISGHGSYKELTARGENFFRVLNEGGTDPTIIARLIKKVIEKKNPKARYSKGHLSRITLLGRRWLSDKTFDRIMLKMTGFR